MSDTEGDKRTFFVLSRTHPQHVRKIGAFVDVSKLRVCWATYQILGTIRWAMDETVPYPPPFVYVEQALSSVTQLSLSQVRPHVLC